MASTARYTYSREIGEKNSWMYRGVLADPLQQPILLSSLTTLTLTLYDVTSNTIINGLNATNILNADRGTVDSAGNLLIHFRPGDSIIVNPGLAVGATEAHIALIECTYNGGQDRLGREIYHKITNLNRVA